MKWSWRLGEFAGIAVYVHIAFLLLIGWVALSHWITGQSLAGVLGGIGFILALFGCVVLHEFGHALSARKYGIRTRDVTLLPIGGVARLERMPDNPIQELWVALAGPAVSVVIAALLFVWLELTTGLEPLGQLGVATGSFVERLMIVNLTRDPAAPAAVGWRAPRLPHPERQPPALVVGLPRGYLVSQQAQDACYDRLGHRLPPVGDCESRQEVYHRQSRCPLLDREPAPAQDGWGSAGDRAADPRLRPHEAGCPGCRVRAREGGWAWPDARRPSDVALIVPTRPRTRRRRTSSVTRLVNCSVARRKVAL